MKHPLYYLKQSVGLASIANLFDSLGFIGTAQVDDRDVMVGLYFVEPRPVGLGPDVALGQALVLGSGGKELLCHEKEIGKWMVRIRVAFIGAESVDSVYTFFWLIVYSAN